MARLEIITGPMFSGKSEEFIRRLHSAFHAGLISLTIKPKIDTRAVGEVFSRKKDVKNDAGFEKFLSFPAFEVQTPEEIVELLEQYAPSILAVDEGQFLGWVKEKDKTILVPKLVPEFVSLFKKFSRNKKHKDLNILISGLDMTSEGDEFEPMSKFMALADKVTKLRAVCFKCKKWPPNATMTYCKEKKDTAVKVGNTEEYEALCQNCWQEAMASRTP